MSGLLKLSGPQLDSLRNTQIFGDPYHGIQGRAQYGGRLATVQSLIARGLIKIHAGVWSVTDAGLLLEEVSAGVVRLSATT